MVRTPVQTNHMCDCPNHLHIDVVGTAVASSGTVKIVRPSRFGQGIKPPRRPNFAQNMHPNKRYRRSLARPNRTTPEYHDVDHGVAVWWPWRFCVIAPIAFVGGMGGWCCRTWCAAVVLRSVVVIFVSCGEHDRKENMTEMSVGYLCVCTPIP